MSSPPPDAVAAPGIGGSGKPDPAGIDILDTSSAGPTVIRGAVLRVAGYAASVGLSIASAALLTRHLGASDFGRYTTVISVVTVAAGLTEAGMTNIGVREYSVLKEPARGRFMRDLLGLRLILTSAGALGALAFAAAAGYDHAMVVGTALAAFGLVVTTVQATWGVSLQARLRLGWMTLVELVRQVATVALIVVLVLAGASLLPFLGVPLAAGVAGVAVTLVLVRGTVPLLPGFGRSEWGRLLRLTLPYAAASAVGIVYIYLTVVLMSLIATQTEVGYFGAAFRVFVVLGGIPGLLVSSAFPVLARAARDDQNRLAYALQRLWEISLIVGAGLALCTAVGARLAVDVVAGSKFDPSVRVLQIQSGAVLASCLVATWGFGLLAVARYRGLLVANAVALVVSATLALSLTPSYGARGAAVATLVGESSLAVGYAVALMARRRDLRVSPRVVPAVALACAAGGAVLLIPGLPEPADLALVALVYVLVLLVLRAIPAEVSGALRGWRAGRREAP